MKKQSGFTLIELLLVLAIIGIISAIAIPALLGQRARARDKSSQTNAVSIVADIISTYDRMREAGTDVSTLALFNANVVGTAAAPVIPAIFNTKNPWGTTPGGYTAAAIAEAAPAGTSTAAAAVAGTKGQVQLGYLPPTALAGGVVATAVYLMPLAPLPKYSSKPATSSSNASLTKKGALVLPFLLPKLT
jgi:type IV pilus assembly protein PilA